MASDLYERDFYLWTREQADALRGRGGGLNQLDYDLLAEEIEDLGSELQRAVASFVARIIQHLYKLQASSRLEPRLHWRTEIRQFRIEIESRMTASIRRVVEAELETLHARGLKYAKTDLAEYERNVVVDASERWTLPQILGEADDPLDRP